MDFKGKKLLILAGAGVHSKVVRAAKEMGIYTIVTDYLEDSPAKQIADEAWLTDIMDTESIVKKCRETGVDGVVNFCIDPAQWPYFKICKELGLPCYGTEKEFEILTDKVAFKKFCRDHQVDVIPDYTLDDIKENRAEYPVFIKPSMSRGSRGQFICYNREEAEEAWHRAEKESLDGNALCEKYMAGKQDLATAYFVIGGEPYLVKFGDRLLGSKSDGLDKQVMCTRLPSVFAGIYEKNVSERVKNMIRKMGVKFGPVFMQGFVDGDTIRYYDPARRMPGGDYDLVLKTATGFDTVKSVIHFALTGDTEVCYGEPENADMLNSGTGLLVSLSVRAGKIDKAVGLEKMLLHPDVVYGRQILPEGSEVPASGDIKQRAAAIGAYVPKGGEPKELLKKVYETYHIYDENGDDMIVSRIDADTL